VAGRYRGKVLHWDGSALSQTFIGISESLFTVHANSQRFAAVGGYGSGLILERDISAPADAPRRLRRRAVRLHRAARRDGLAHGRDRLAPGCRLETLRRMHELAPSIVARSHGGLAGYALTMRLEARADVPILEPMFQLFETLSWRGRPLPETRCYVMGQVCVFDAIYRGHRDQYRDRFELLVTEVSLRNPRSCAPTSAWASSPCTAIETASTIGSFRAGIGSPAREFYLTRNSAREPHGGEVQAARAFHREWMTLSRPLGTMAP